MSFKVSERMEYLKASMIREVIKYSLDPEVITFTAGTPDLELYPFDEYREASYQAFEEFGRSMLHYDVTDGFLPLRKIIAQERMTSVGVDTSEENIFITNGSQQGIDFAARIFLDKDDVVITENPSYLGALNVFESYMAKNVQVPMDENGMIMEELEKAIQSNPKVKFIYTTPDFQNPTGLSMSLDRRKKMIEIAEKYNIPIVEDNPYGELRFEGEKIPTVKSFDTKGLVIYLGTFSKFVIPGSRIAWVCASNDMLEKFIKVKQLSDLQPNTITQRELTKFIQTHSVDDHIKKIIPVYRERRDIMIEAIKKELPTSVKYTVPEGGLFIWLTLPDGVDAMELFRKAVKTEKVAFIPGAPFMVKEGPDNHIRLSYSAMKEDQINEGIKRLGKALRTLL